MMSPRGGSDGESTWGCVRRKVSLSDLVRCQVQRGSSNPMKRREEDESRWLLRKQVSGANTEEEEEKKKKKWSNSCSTYFWAKCNSM